MTKPILYDLYCCAGGAAKGYANAGFEVVGVDIKPQPKYPYEFHQADALEFLAANWRRAQAVHASPPCQGYSALRHIQPDKVYPDLLVATRDALKLIGLPYVIENVPGSPIEANLMLCGTIFRLATPCGAELRRHRYFEAPWFCDLVPPCEHGWAKRTIGIYGDVPQDPKIWRASKRLAGRVIGIYGKTAENPALCNHGRTISVTGHTANDCGAIERRRTISVHGTHPRDENIRWKNRTISVTGSTAQQNTVHNAERETFSVKDAQVAMGIDWMGMKELSQAIPPAYTEFIGRALMRELERAR